MEDIVEKEKLLYEGKAKKLYFTDDSEVLWVEYCDQATALNGARKEQITGKGALNNQITSLIFEKSPTFCARSITTSFGGLK